MAQLALDIRWSWNHVDDEIWQQFNLALWEINHNPWIILQTVSQEQLMIQSKTLGKMIENEESRKMLMDKINNNKIMKKYG